MVDSRAVAADVALDLAASCRTRRRHRLRQEVMLRIKRHRHRTEDLGLRAAMTPVPRRNERPRPQARLTGTRSLFLSNIDISIAQESERPAAGHHRCVDVGVADKAGHDAPVIAVDLVTAAGYRL